LIDGVALLKMRRRDAMRCVSRRQVTPTCKRPRLWPADR